LVGKNSATGKQGEAGGDASAKKDGGEGAPESQGEKKDGPKGDGGNKNGEQSPSQRQPDPKQGEKQGEPQEGEQQALHASSLLQFHGLRDDVDLVVSSPLRRTLHTATLLYANHEAPPPFVACELAREAHGDVTDPRPALLAHLLELVRVGGSGSAEQVWARARNPGARLLCACA
jgi:hypothetical protein